MLEEKLNSASQLIAVRLLDCMKPDTNENTLLANTVPVFRKQISLVKIHICKMRRHKKFLFFQSVKD